jgi:oxaloacetate decarboxylase alpha subunit
VTARRGLGGANDILIGWVHLLKRNITITDTTLRDGQQTLWATRMRTEWMVPVIERQEKSGVSTVDVTGVFHFLSMVRFLQEDPWERIRTFRRLLSRPTLAAAAGGDTFGIFNVAPLDIRELFIEACIRNGIDLIRDFHGLLDVDIMAENLKFAKKAGARTQASLVFSESPVHTDELYETRAREIVRRANVDWVQIKDSGGLLTPERAGSLIDAVRRGAGDAKVTLHSHCIAGMAHRVYMIGAEHGVDDLQCSIWPLALGWAQPSMQTVVRNLREEGYVVEVDDREIDAASEYLIELARRHGLPLGAAIEYDHRHYYHQIPGGMWANLLLQLKEAGLLDRLQDIVRETSRVRSELGWVTMVTPYSQFVVNQALLNILTGERYTTVPDQVKMYVLGYFGKPLASVDPNVMDRIIENGSKTIKEEPEELQPALPGLRKRNPKASDEELLLRYMCSEQEIALMLERRDSPVRPQPVDRLPGRVEVRVLTDLLGRIAALRDAPEVVVEKGALRIRVAH